MIVTFGPKMIRVSTLRLSFAVIVASAPTMTRPISQLFRMERDPLLGTTTFPQILAFQPNMIFLAVRPPLPWALRSLVPRTSILFLATITDELTSEPSSTWLPAICETLDPSPILMLSPEAMRVWASSPRTTSPPPKVGISSSGATVGASPSFAGGRV